MFEQLGLEQLGLEQLGQSKSASAFSLLDQIC